MKKYIGGEFCYDKKFFLNTSNKHNFRELNWISSGRAAFYNILKKYKKKGYKKVYLPAYICDSLIWPVKKLGLKITFYALDKNLNIKDEFKGNAIILIIHFFGKRIKNIEKIKKDIPKNSKIIEDYTHIFLNQNLFNKKNKDKIFFSMRKHFGFISGAYHNEKTKKLINNNKLLTIYKNSQEILNVKFNYLKKHNYNLKTENTYLKKIKFNDHLISLNTSNYQIPDLIKNFNNNLDIEIIRQKRKKNWKTLYQLIKNKVECFHSDFRDGDIPFGFIIKVKNRDVIKRKLKNANIFAPIHWEWPTNINKKKFNNLYELSESILTLPIDQRYDISHMELLAKKLKKII